MVSDLGEMNEQQRVLKNAEWTAGLALRIGCAGLPLVFNDPVLGNDVLYRVTEVKEGMRRRLQFFFGSTRGENTRIRKQVENYLMASGQWIGLGDAHQRLEAVSKLHRLQCCFSNSIMALAADVSTSAAKVNARRPIGKRHHGG